MTLEVEVDCVLDGTTLEFTVFDVTAGTQEAVTLFDGKQSYTLSTLAATTGHDYDWQVRRTDSGTVTAQPQVKSVKLLD